MHVTSYAVKGARSYFSKFNFIFHFKDHHTEELNLKFQLNWSNRFDLVILKFYMGYEKNMSFFVIPKSQKVGKNWTDMTGLFKVRIRKKNIRISDCLEPIVSWKCTFYCVSCVIKQVISKMILVLLMLIFLHYLCKMNESMRGLGKSLRNIRPKQKHKTR